MADDRPWSPYINTGQRSPRLRTVGLFLNKWASIGVDRDKSG
jgi:hypothetical protein